MLIYVDDLEILWRREIADRHYQQCFALAHSMGSTIVALLLVHQPRAFHAAVLVTPMFDILLPMPRWIATRILNWAEKRPIFSENYAPGTGRWQPWPFMLNELTHSRERYRRNLRFFADEPGLRLGGPTYHWVREGMQAGSQVMASVSALNTPLLLLQAEEETVVDNSVQDHSCALMRAAGHSCEGDTPHTF